MSRVRVESHRPPVGGRVRGMALLVGALCTAAAAPRAAGQSPRGGIVSLGDVAIGITMQAPKDVNQRPLCEEMSLYCAGSGRTFPELGLSASVARNLMFGVGVVGEAAVYGNYWRTGPEAGQQHTNLVRSALAGLRFATPFSSYPRTERDSVRIFAQVLAGTQWSTLDPGRPILQPGGGFEVASKRATVRIEFDYCRVSGKGRDLSTGRWLGGVVYRFGSGEP